MDEMTVAEADMNCSLSDEQMPCTPSGWQKYRDSVDLVGLSVMIDDQRTRYLADNPDTPDTFKPLSECTKADLIAELNSDEYRSAG